MYMSVFLDFLQTHVSIFCPLRMIKMSRKDISFPFSVSYVNWMKLRKLLRRDSKNSWYPSQTKQMVSSPKFKML